MTESTYAIDVTDLTVAYQEKPVLWDVDLQAPPGVLLAIVGPNGAGKTTFLRTVLGQIPPLAGMVQVGANLRLGVFTQSHDDLASATSVLDELLNRTSMSLGEARSYLAQYMFRGEDIYKPTGALSGGERSRLALALLALEHPNFLLLDEPTNHLDIPAQEVLQEVVENFEGTALLVSHDRYLIDRLATQVWELRDGRLHVFPGTYAEMLAERERQAAEARQARVASRASAEAREANGAARDARKRAEAAARLESDIYDLEARIEALGNDVQQAAEGGDYEAVRTLGEAYQAAQHDLEQLMGEWELIAEL